MKIYNHISSRWRGSAAALTAIVLLGAPAHGVKAADLFWDANGDTTAATGGTGNWVTPSTNTWHNGSSAGALQTWADGETVASVQRVMLAAGTAWPTNDIPKVLKNSDWEPIPGVTKPAPQ